MEEHHQHGGCSPRARSGCRGTSAPGLCRGPQGGHLGVVAEGQRGDLLRVTEPVLLGARVQVLHHHQAAARVGEEACGQTEPGGPAHHGTLPHGPSHRGSHPRPTPPRRKAGGAGGPEEHQDRPPTAPGPWPHPCVGSRSGWCARSRCSPRRPSDAATRHQQVAGRGPVGKRPGRGVPTSDSALRPGLDGARRCGSGGEAAEGRTVGGRERREARQGLLGKAWGVGRPGQGREEPGGGLGGGRREGAGTVWGRGHTGHSPPHWHGSEP